MARKAVKLEWIMDISNHQTGVSFWLQNQHLDPTEHTISTARETYLLIIKPIIHRYHKCKDKA